MSRYVAIKELVEDLRNRPANPEIEARRHHHLPTGRKFVMNRKSVESAALVSGAMCSICDVGYFCSSRDVRTPLAMG
jgi:hypothetical protein